MEMVWVNLDAILMLSLVAAATAVGFFQTSPEENSANGE